MLAGKEGTVDLNIQKSCTYTAVLFHLMQFCSNQSYILQSYILLIFSVIFSVQPSWIKW